MKTLFIFIFIFFVIYTQGQNYQPIYSTQSALFRNHENKILGLRIDSVKIESDTTLYPFTTIQEITSEAGFSPYETSWIGKNIIIKNDGSNLFFNREGETITIKNQAKLNESWLAYQRTDSFQVKASVHNIDLEEFLGLEDSVKTIAFSVLNQFGDTISHKLNNLKVKISKNYGFVETLNFYLFPDFTVHYPSDRLENYTLVGLTNPITGVQNLKWFDVFDYNVGDELHVQEYKTGDSYNVLPYISYDKRCIYKFLKRDNYTDSIVYQYVRKQSIETVFKDSLSLEKTNDTVRWVISVNPNFDKLPGEPIIDNFSAYSFYMRSDTLLQKIDPNETLIFIFEENGWFLDIFVGEGCFYEKKYLKGLGGPYYSCKGYFGESEERKLIYYKKGETEWGEPLVLTGIHPIVKNNMVTIFPNPAKNKISITTLTNQKINFIQLINLNGEILLELVEPGTNHVKIDVNNFPTGTYIVKVTSNKKTFVKKIFIEN